MSLTSYRAAPPRVKDMLGRWAQPGTLYFRLGGPKAGACSTPRHFNRTTALLLECMVPDVARHFIFRLGGAEVFSVFRFRGPEAFLSFRPGGARAGGVLPVVKLTGQSLAGKPGARDSVVGTKKAALGRLFCFLTL